MPSFKTIAYVVDQQIHVKKTGICRRYFLLKGSCAPSVKITNMYVLGLILLSVLVTTGQTRLY